MKHKVTLIIGLAVVLLCAVAWVALKHRAAREAEFRAAQAQREATLARTGEPTPPAEKPTVTTATLAPRPTNASTGSLARNTQAVVELADPPLNVKTQQLAKAKAAKPKPEKVVQDPLARVALSLVGLDEDAEMYWFAAIQDPTLPTSERQDLIDDLNEEGLPDPKHPTLDDLPLILRRLDILEDLILFLGPEFDWKEPHDDLVNLLDLAQGRGKPVQ